MLKITIHQLCVAKKILQMKYCVPKLFFFLLSVTTGYGQTANNTLKLSLMDNYEIIRTESRIPGLQIALTHKTRSNSSGDYAVLFLHGSSFPSALAFAFRMNNYSWMDNLAENGYDVYALDFLGYGNADRYPEMETDNRDGHPVGRAIDIYKDVDKAVDLIIRKTGKTKVYLIGHSWGGTVAALYASKFSDKVEKLILFSTITARQGTSAIEKIEGSYKEMTAVQRINSMQDLTPEGRDCRLEEEIFQIWGKAWLQSDPLAAKFKVMRVRFPNGYAADVEDLMHNKLYYNPAAIQVPVLVIRGEWDSYPDNVDSEKLFKSLENISYKKYVVIEKATHVMHLEKSRHQLYEETTQFLKFGTEYERNK